MTEKILTIGHSPDADDAFMFYGFATGKVQIPGYDIVQVLEDIESLNQRALKGELHVTAISAAMYPRVASRYRIMRTGSSIGRAYGPKLIAREHLSEKKLQECIVALPGEHTTAALLFRLRYPGVQTRVVPFEEVLDIVRDGKVDAGVCIHEGQLSYRALGLVELLDLGEWWHRETHLPIPLGLDVIRRDIPEDDARMIRDAYAESIRTAYRELDKAIEYALEFGRGQPKDLIKKFVQMYVNEDTMDMGEEGLKALQELYRRAYASGLLSSIPQLDIL